MTVMLVARLVGQTALRATLAIVCWWVYDTAVDRFAARLAARAHW